MVGEWGYHTCCPRKSYPVNAKHQLPTLSTGKASTSCPLTCNVCVITDVITGKQGVRIGDGAADDHSLKLFVKSERVQLMTISNES